MQGLAVQGRTWAMALREVRTMEGSELWRDMPKLRCSQAPSGGRGGNRLGAGRAGLGEEAWEGALGLGLVGNGGAGPGREPRGREK